MSAPIEVEATVVGRAEPAAGQHLLTLAAGQLCRLGAPGRFAMVRCSDGWDPYLRRPLPFLRLAGEAASFLFQATDRGLAWLARRALGDRVSLIAPLGHGFGLQPGTRRLLLATERGPLAPLLALADAALAAEVSVSLALAPAMAAQLAPLIPEAVELLPAEEGAVWPLAAAHLAWADQVALAGTGAELAPLQDWAAARPDGTVQCYVDAPMACGLGWCGSCLAETHRGPRRTCVSGPVFDLTELA